jgi:hypothetical protein
LFIVACLAAPCSFSAVVKLVCALLTMAENAASDGGLRDLLRHLRVANLPQRRRVDEADVPFHQRGKGRFCKGRLGLAGGELAHQCHVIAHHHLYMAAERGFGQFFLGFNRQDACSALAPADGRGRRSATAPTLGGAHLSCLERGPG